MRDNVSIHVLAPTLPMGIFFNVSDDSALICCRSSNALSRFIESDGKDMDLMAWGLVGLSGPSWASLGFPGPSWAPRWALMGRAVMGPLMCVGGDV